MSSGGPTPGTATSTNQDDKVHRPTGCPHGCGPDGHDPDCGLDAFIAERRRRRAAWVRRDAEHVAYERWFAYWVPFILGDREAA